MFAAPLLRRHPWGLSARTDDVRVKIMFFVAADQDRCQFMRQFLRRLAFNLKLTPDRHLHLATQSQPPLCKSLLFRAGMMLSATRLTSG